MSLINERIIALRAEMKAKKLDAFIMPTSDPHQSEYAAPHWESRQWISGFTGSAGTFFLTLDYAGLSTDSRYFLQAQTELAESEIVLHRQKIPHSPQIIPWLIEHLPRGGKVGVDPQLFSIKQIQSYQRQLEKGGLSLVFRPDFIGGIWNDRPALPKDMIFELGLEYAGTSRIEKLKKIRSAMRDLKVDYHLVTTLDDIAWIFNIRGKDVACNPVAIAYAVIGLETCTLFINAEKIPAALKNKFEKEHIEVAAYDSIQEFLGGLQTTDFILLDPNKTNGELDQAITEARIVPGANISTALKARKNETEVKNIRQAMLKDGVALTRLFMWLEAELQERSIPETEVATKLAQLRSDQGDYHGESFSAIVGYKGNGAIVHYRAKEESCASIEADGILLLDSGGQYLCGTTDITRTVALGPVTDIQKRDYTLVLKGHISLATLKFPHGTRGNQMELLARKALWEYGLNYGHGTGHGVGFFLNVHEGPQALGSGATAKAATVFDVGMFTSNEPGFYKTGEYGIRIENLILCVEDQKTDYGRFLKFETLTLFPIDTSLIDFSLLTREEVQWLNDYHQEVYDQLVPLLEETERKWMAERCRAI